MRTQLGGGGGVAAVQSWEDSKERKAIWGGGDRKDPPGEKHLQLTCMGEPSAHNNALNREDLGLPSYNTLSLVRADLGSTFLFRTM